MDLMKMFRKNGRLNPRYMGEYAIIAFIAVILSIAILTFLMDYLVMPLYQRAGLEFSAPDLRGMTVGEAEDLTKDKKLTIIIDAYEYSPEYPEDTIALQMPSPGTTIKPGRRRHVKISQGSHPFTVPDVEGESERNAKLQIQSAGLFVKESIMRPSNKYPYGVVAGQDPEAGSKVPGGTGIVVYISNGEKETNIIMPNLINMSMSAAQDTLMSYGFKYQNIKVQFEENRDKLPDTVIEQYPDPGTASYEGEEVNLVVSK
jgi:serine/threonine-protein kinase